MISHQKKIYLGILTFFCLGTLILILTANPEPSLTRKFFGVWRSRYFLFGFSAYFVALALILFARSKEALSSFLLVCVSIAICMVTLEIAGHTRIVSWPDIFTPKFDILGQSPSPNVNVSGETYQDTATRWGIPSSPISFKYKTDRYGYRNRQDRENADIYLIGDSILVAALVEEDSIIASRLEDLTRKSVMQIALIGKSPQEMQTRFNTLPFDLKGKIVLQFIFEGNDLRDSLRYRKEHTSSTKKDFRANSFINNLLVLLTRMTQPVAGQAELQTCSIKGKDYTFLWIRNSFAGYLSEIPEVLKSLELQRAEVEEKGGSYGVVYVPSKFRVLAEFCTFPGKSILKEYRTHLSPFRNRIIEWSKMRQVDFIDLTMPLKLATDEGIIPWYWSDTHLNSDGHKVTARVLTDWLNSN